MIAHAAVEVINSSSSSRHKVVPPQGPIVAALHFSSPPVLREGGGDEYEAVEVWKHNCKHVAGCGSYLDTVVAVVEVVLTVLQLQIFVIF